MKMFHNGFSMFKSNIKLMSMDSKMRGRHALHQTNIKKPRNHFHTLGFGHWLIDKCIEHCVRSHVGAKCD